LYIYSYTATYVEYWITSRYLHGCKGHSAISKHISKS